ncbi:hypothetical protein yberc0001_26310 [Yersinia bercovieri ATCC 43970]|uniref:MFS transporter n=1 Tax=Yersinia bercovieri ATCC 43970 TaxID=349968 RepID=A0ABP2E0N2_YERBE|nr:hypothetical protein yberc0001_26310 [Yersinia bercovieri ATCC 43970]
MKSALWIIVGENNLAMNIGIFVMEFFTVGNLSDKSFRYSLI